MSVIVKNLEEKVARYENYLKDSKKNNTIFNDISLEIEGYMSSLTGFLFGHMGF